MILFKGYEKMEKRISRKFKPVINHTHGDKANIFAVISLLYIMIVKLPHRPTTCHDPMHLGYIFIGILPRNFEKSLFELFGLVDAYSFFEMRIVKVLYHTQGYVSLRRACLTNCQ